MLGQGKGANTAHGVAGHRGSIVVGQHLGLKAKGVLEATVADLAVTGSNHQQTAAFFVSKGQGLGNTSAFYTYSLCGQFYRCTGNGKLQNILLAAQRGKKGTNFFNGHN